MTISQQCAAHEEAMHDQLQGILEALEGVALKQRTYKKVNDEISKEMRNLKIQVASTNVQELET